MKTFIGVHGSECCLRNVDHVTLWHMKRRIASSLAIILKVMSSYFQDEIEIGVAIKTCKEDNEEGMAEKFLEEACK